MRLLLNTKVKTGNMDASQRNQAISSWKTKDILERWGRYIKGLCNDPKRTIIPLLFEGELSGPESLELEIEHAIKQFKVGKATGLDNISCEMFRTLGQEGIGVLSSLFNQIYSQGILPEEMCQSVLVPLPKKPDTLLCEEHRTISLTSHLTEVMLKVLGKRIKPKAETELNVSQFGFVTCWKLLAEVSRKGR